MPRVVPSRVVAFIDRTWPGGLLPNHVMDFANLTDVSGLVDLVERIPDELLVLDPDQYTALLATLAVLRTAVGAWQAGVRHHTVASISAVPGFHVVTALRNVIAQCKDEAPSSQTTGLAFITDAELRENIRLDMRAAQRNIAEGQR